MKNESRIFGIIVLIAVIAFTATACGKGSSKSKAPSGTYENTNMGVVSTFTFLAGNKVVNEIEVWDVKQEGTWAIEKINDVELIKITITDEHGNKTEHFASLQDDKLEVAGYTYTKKK